MGNVGFAPAANIWFVFLSHAEQACEPLKTFPTFNRHQAAFHRRSCKIIICVAAHRACFSGAAAARVDVRRSAQALGPHVHGLQRPALVSCNILTCTWTPRARLRAFGDFSFFQAFMSQPKKQLKTFAGWAGVSSDISFYLNSHHVDYHCWCMQGLATPISVCALASTGVANAALGRDCADSVTLMVQWRSDVSGNLGVATYTASWSASPSDVHRCAIPRALHPSSSLLHAHWLATRPHPQHSQQRFFYSGHGGDITVDQAHRFAPSFVETL
jgi:hypothetical protein